MAKRKNKPVEAQFVRSPDFQESFDEAKARFPKIEERLAVFLEHKRERPPRPLPKSFSDHHLAGRLAGHSECHLGPNVCLMYSDQDHIVKLNLVVTHDELHGPREKALAKKLKKKEGANPKARR